MALLAKRLLTVQNLANFYFVEQFRKNKRAQEYVYSRISKETAELFNLGYAPDVFRINKFLEKHTNDEEAILKSKIIAKGKDGHYSFFENRITLPFFIGRDVVGFGSRALSTKQKAKYLNSPESPTYAKRDHLYTLWESRRYMAELGWGLLMEGYFDALTLFDRGIRNGCGLASAALTKGHADKLARYTDKIVVMLDGDEGGKKGTARAKKILKEKGIYYGSVALPAGKDPDEIVTERGTKGFLKLIKSNIVKD